MYRWLAMLFAAWTLTPVGVAEENDEAPDEEFLEFLGLWESQEDEDWIELMEMMAPRDGSEQAVAREGEDRG